MKDINLKVIVPLHEYNKDISKLLSEAVASVPENISVVVSCKNGIGDASEEMTLSLKEIEQMKKRLDKYQYASFM